MKKVVNNILNVFVFILIIIVLFTADLNVSMLLRFVVLCIFYYCIKEAIKQNRIINVYTLFAFTPLSLFIYNSKFSPTYLMELNVSTWFIAIINMIAFLIGYRITKIKSNNTNIKHQLTKYDKSKLKVHIYILGVLSALSFIIFNYTGLKMPISSFTYFLGYIGLALAYKIKEKKYICISLVFICYPFINDFDKNKVIILAICTFVCYEAYYINNARDKSKLILGIALGIIFVLVVAFPLKDYIRNGGSYLDFAQNSKEISNEAFQTFQDKMYFNGPEFLKMPIMYAISPWNNLQYIIETQNWHTYGLWTIKPFLNYIGLENHFEFAYKLEPYSSFNTYTYITVAYKDYGYFGSIIMSLLLGLYVKYVYIKYEQTGSAFYVASFGLVGFAVFQMYFNNHFFMLSYPFTILIAGYLYKKIFKLDKY